MPLAMIHHQRDGSVAAQGFGIRTGLVRCVHDALSLGALVRQVVALMDRYNVGLEQESLLLGARELD